MALIDSFKKIAANTADAADPVAVLFGTVIRTDPLAVSVDQRFELSEDFLIQTEATSELKVTINGVDQVVRRGLQSNDKVVLLRAQGGQQYVVLDRVVT